MVTVLNERSKGALVTTSHVNTLVKNYKISRWVDNSEKIGKPDSLSTWFGMDELFGFLQTAKEYKADGIKMYFGVYPENYAIDPLKAGRQTIVLVATRKSGSPESGINKAILINKDGNKEILAFNVGEICPPFCGGGDPPDFEPVFRIDTDHIGFTLIEKNGNLELL